MRLVSKHGEPYRFFAAQIRGEDYPIREGSCRSARLSVYGFRNGKLRSREKSSIFAFEKEPLLLPCRVDVLGLTLFDRDVLGFPYNQ